MTSLAAAVAVLSACSPQESIATSPGTVPPVWTGVADPFAEDMSGAHGSTPEESDTSDEHGGDGVAAEPGRTTPRMLTAILDGLDGSQVGAASIELGETFATVTVQTVGGAQLSPGLHALVLGNVGKCELNSTAPSGGGPGAFLSAGDPTWILVPLQVRADGSGTLVTTTDAVTEEDLLDSDKSAMVLYDQSESGAGQRVACGVITVG